jgi:hypothetical protein
LGLECAIEGVLFQKLLVSEASSDLVKLTVFSEEVRCQASWLGAGHGSDFILAGCGKRAGIGMGVVFSGGFGFVWQTPASS